MQSGWDCVVPHAAIRSFRYQVVTISAFSSEGDERILFLGTLDSLLGTVARDRAQALAQQVAERQQEVAALREQLAVSEHQRHLLDGQIAAMRQSRFWRARDRWFAIKRAARIDAGRVGGGCPGCATGTRLRRDAAGPAGGTPQDQPAGRQRSTSRRSSIRATFRDQPVVSHFPKPVCGVAV